MCVEIFTYEFFINYFCDKSNCNLQKVGKKQCPFFYVNEVFDALNPTIFIKYLTCFIHLQVKDSQLLTPTPKNKKTKKLLNE